MTAPDRTTWTLVDDGWGDPTIWTDGDHAVATRCGDRIHIDPAFTEQVWEALTRALAPDEATIERLAEAACRGEGLDWDQVIPGAKPHFRDNVRAVLAALADTSAQARHTAGNTTGGGEHG